MDADLTCSWTWDHVTTRSLPGKSLSDPTTDPRLLSTIDEALGVACSNDRLEIVRTMVAFGAEPDQSLGIDALPGILHAAAGAATNVIRYLHVDVGCDVAVTSARDSSTALHLAAEARMQNQQPYVKCVEYLLQYIDVDSRRSKDTATPLHLAARAGKDKIVKCLLDHGADPTLEAVNINHDNKNLTPLALAQLGAKKLGSSGHSRCTVYLTRALESPEHFGSSRVSRPRRRTFSLGRGPKVAVNETKGDVAESDHDVDYSGRGSHSEGTGTHVAEDTGAPDPTEVGDTSERSSSQARDIDHACADDDNASLYSASLQGTGKPGCNVNFGSSREPTMLNLATHDNSANETTVGSAEDESQSETPELSATKNSALIRALAEERDAMAALREAQQRAKAAKRLAKSLRQTSKDAGRQRRNSLPTVVPADLQTDIGSKTHASGPGLLNASGSDKGEDGSIGPQTAATAVVQFTTIKKSVGRASRPMSTTSTDSEVSTMMRRERTHRRPRSTSVGVMDITSYRNHLPRPRSDSISSSLYGAESTAESDVTEDEFNDLQVESVSTDTCALCHKMCEIQLCVQCLAIGYCSRECQRMDWKRHKHVCRQHVPHSEA